MNPHKTKPHRENSHTCKNSQTISSPAPKSPSFSNLSDQALFHSLSPQPPSILSNSSPFTMPLEVSTKLQTWLTRHGLSGYLHVYNAPAHPWAQAIGTKIHLSTITNDIIRSALRLPRGGGHDIEAPPQHTLEQYFGEYSLSAKAHHTHSGPNEFFGDLAHLMLEYS